MQLMLFDFIPKRFEVFIPISEVLPVPPQTSNMDSLTAGSYTSVSD